MDQWMTEMSHFFMQYGVFGLFVLSFVEASFFPIPPYLLSIPMTLAEPQLGLYYALVGTIGSVLGGLFGYALGLRFGRPLLMRFVKSAVLKKFEVIYQRWGDWATAAGGLTPLPYKIFAISAGVFQTRLATFIPASLFARSVRFFGEALLLMFFGRKVLKFLETVFGPTNLLISIALFLILILLWRSGLISEKFLSILRQIKERWLDWIGRLYQRILPTGLFTWYLVTGATLTAFGFLIFSKLASELLENELSHFDSLISQWITSCRGGWMTKIMLGITTLGSTWWVMGLVLVISVSLFLLHKRLLALSLDIAIAGAALLTELLKGTFHRTRPSLPWLTTASGYSFPSGHALLSFTLYGFLAYLVVRNSGHNRWKYTLGAGLLLLPILIGISRIYLGVHYPSDVLAGWALAAGWTGTCMAGNELRNSMRSKD